MDGAQEFASWSNGDLPTTLAPKSRRSLPPELVHAVELERLYWSLHIKGLDKNTIVPVPRARRLGVRFLEPAAHPAIGINAALREIEHLRPTPALIPALSAVRRRGIALERWFSNEVAPCVLWFLLHPIAGKGAQSTILRGFDLIAGLTDRRPYLLGDQLSSTDITAAAVLAPIARSEGWAWAGGRTWIPMGPRAGRLPPTSHPGAVWVRNMYERHGVAREVVCAPVRAWLP